MKKLFLLLAVITLGSLSSMTNAGLLGDIFDPYDDTEVVYTNGAPNDGNGPVVRERRYYRHHWFRPDTETVVVD